MRKDLHQSQQLTREKDIEIVHLQKKLKTETLERDVKISEQEEELRTLNSRMDDQKEEFERELARGQELHLCEEERKHSLLAEMESNKLKAEERLEELEAVFALEPLRHICLLLTIQNPLLRLRSQDILTNQFVHIRLCLPQQVSSQCSHAVEPGRLSLIMSSVHSVNNVDH